VYFASDGSCQCEKSVVSASIRSVSISVSVAVSLQNSHQNTKVRPFVGGSVTAVWLVKLIDLVVVRHV
jgi:hypothetical protein